MTTLSSRHDGLTPGDLGWLRHRSRAYITNVVRNLRHAERNAIPALRPAEGRVRSAIIVGAGPSLERNRHLLGEAQRNGWTIICVNASLAAVMEHVEPDYCVARELVAIHLGLPEIPSRTKLVVDIGAHPAVFDRAAAYFIPAQSRVYDVCEHLSVRPVYAGSAALTSAARIALDAGAERIALVGTDLAFARSGQGYSAGAQWEGLDLTGDRFSDEALRQVRGICAAAGMPMSIREDDASELVAAADGGSPLRALPSWTNQATWLTAMAASRADVLFTNATEGGRWIEGWAHEPLSMILDEASVCDDDEGWLRMSEPGDHAYAALWSSLRASCDRLERIAAEVMEPTDEGFAGIHDFYRGSQFVEAWAQRDYIDAEGLPVAEQLVRYENARIEAAKAMRAMMEAA